MKIENEIKCETVRSRVKRNNLTGYSASRDSPIREIENYIAQTIIQMSRINKPLSISGCIQLANSMISGTAYFEKLVEFKRSRGINSKTMELGKSWFRSFCKRNPSIITTRAVKFAVNRAEWCNVENVKIMYDCIYSELVDAGVAKQLAGDGYWLDEEGNISDTNSFGRKTRFELTYPEYLLFVDEVGSNTNMSKDGNKGGEKLACERGNAPRQQASTFDTHFTVLGFTDAQGTPVMCAIIMSGNSLTADQILGIDVFNATIEDAKL